jgi:UDP-N-acetylmuramoyl-L-alanyl-D-glutamate--2,6-diaminopimelate ligase
MGAFRNYRRANLRMLDSLKSSGLAILNADDPVINNCLDKIEVPFLTTAIKQEAEITARLLERARSEQTFLLTAGSESIPVRTAIIGDQHIRNCLSAAAVGLSLGLDLTTIATGLEKASQLPGRLERVECGQQFSVWVDAARTVGQLANALRTVRQVTSGQVWCICTIEDGQTPELRRRLGEVIDRTAGFRNPADAELIPDRFKAIEWILSNAKTGDSVLVTGCGERPFAILGDENWTVTDRDVCQAWLYDNASLKPGDSMQSSSNKDDIYRMDDYR